MLYRDPRKTAPEKVDRDPLAGNRANAERVEARQWLRLYRFRTTWGLAFGAFRDGCAV
jgi:hypothetical protein